MSTIEDRIGPLIGKRMRITLAWIDEGTSQRREVVGTVTGAFLLGRAGYFLLDDGATAIESTRVVVMERVPDSA